MPYCRKCHRPMKAPTHDGLGPVCRKRAAPPLAPHERDLFGYSPAAAEKVARERVRIHIEMQYVDACISIRHEFAAARRRLGIWA